MTTPASLFLEKDYRLRTGDFDRYRRLHPTAVLDLFQDIGGLQAEMMGIGYDAMAAQDVFWAVVRTAYQVEHTPAEHEVVKVSTWPHSPSRFSFQRDYALRSTDGSLLVRGTSEWVLMDMNTRSLTSVLDYYHGSLDFLDERMFAKKLRKIRDFTEEDSGLSITPRYSDVDQNGHVNNARYASFVLDALDPSAAGSIASFQIDFRHEVIEGTPLVVFTQVEGKDIQAKGLDSSGEIKFACKITAQA